MKKKFNNWKYLGLSKETLLAFADRVAFDNLRILYVECLVLGVLTFVSSALLMFFNYNLVKNIVLVSTSAACFLITYISNDLKKNGSDKLSRTVDNIIFIFEIIFYLMVTFIGTYYTSNYAALMVGAVLITQVSFDLTPVKNLCLLLMGNIIFFTTGFIFKDHSVLMFDAFNIGTSSVMALIISWKKARTKYEHEESIELIERNNSQLYLSSCTDPLTGLLNRRNAFDKLEVMAARASILNKEIVCMIMDLDYFKRFNDTYGHPEGDKLLENLGSLLCTVNEKYDITISRIGGEEFMAFWILNPDISPRYVAEEIRASVKQLPHPESDKGLFSTVSIGIYMNAAGAEDTASKLYSNADRAVYEAKRKGRDRVEMYDNSIEE